MWLKKTDVVCITGGATGLGAELAEHLVEHGCAVAVIDVVEPEQRNPSVLYFSVDVRDLDAMDKCVESIATQLGTVTVLVNNAAIRRPWQPVLYAAVADMQAVLDVNLLGTLISTRVFLPGMARRERGLIVFISSALSMQSPAGLASYGASKAGVLGVYESVKSEFPPNTGIKALLVCPGQLDTEMFGDVKTPSTVFAPVLSKSQLARQIARVISRGGDGTLYTPFYVHFLPMLRAVPEPITRRIRRLSGMDYVHPDQIAKIHVPI